MSDQVDRTVLLLVLIDDAGFGNPATFGGPIDTPNYDRMAAQGLRYNRFHRYLGIKIPPTNLQEHDLEEARKFAARRGSRLLVSTGEPR
jgi:hypothetical protein